MAAKIITIAAIKGGTGKTATAGALLFAGKNAGKRVLAVDMDPQANLSIWLGSDFSKAGSYDLLSYSERVDGMRGAAREVNTLKAIQETKFGIDLIGATANLMAMTVTKAGSGLRLQDALQQVKNKYDLIVIDSAPQMGELQNNALLACNRIVITVVPDGFCLQGFYQITDIAEIACKDTKIKYAGVLVTQYDARPSLSRFMIGKLQEIAAARKVPYLGEIRRGVAVPEAIALKKNLFEYAGKSKPAMDYLALYEKLEKDRRR